MLALHLSEGSARSSARIAGLCYLAGALASLLGQLVIPDRLVVANNAATTAANILAHEPLYRFSAILALACIPFHVVWAVLFFRLFKPVNETLVTVAGGAMLLACAVWTLCFLFAIASLTVLKGTRSFSAFAPEQLQAVALVFVRLNAQAYDVGLAFFGWWCMLVGYLIYKSHFLPRTIGALYALAGVAYLTLLYAPLSRALYPYNLALAGPGELSLLLWLLVKGVDEQRWKDRAQQYWAT